MITTFAVEHKPLLAYLRGIIMVFLTLQLSTFAHANSPDTLVHEPFDAPGRLGQALTQTQDSVGFTGDWFVPQGHAEGWRVGAAGKSLPYPANARLTGRGGHAVAEHRGHELYLRRKLGADTHIDFNRDGTWYVSAIMRHESGTTGSRFFHVHLVNDAGNDVLATMGFRSSGELQVGGHYRRGSEWRSVGPSLSDMNVLLVMKIVTQADGPTQLFINAYRQTDIIPASTPERWTLQTQVNNRGVADALQIAAGADIRRVAVDEIRIGRTWRSVAAARHVAGEVLYNGIELPALWPPRDIPVQTTEPMPVPYLDAPPSVTPIDVGRQLFVDDFLIEEATLTRRFHRAQRYEGNPVLKPETDLEMNHGNMPVASVFSGGVFYDPHDELFKMWYHAGWFDGTALAVSKDGLNWTRPDLPVEPGTNRVVPHRDGIRRDSAAAWLDHHAPPEERFKLFIWSRPVGGEVYVSPDGKTFGQPIAAGPSGDRSTFFYNPFRAKWVYSLRSSARNRSRHYYEHDDFLQGAKWQAGDPVFWTAADRLDRPDPNIDNHPAQLYNLDATPYESLMLGVFSIHRGPANPVCSTGGYPKITDLELAFSRDGFHWDRPNREAFIAATRTKVDRDNAPYASDDHPEYEDETTRTQSHWDRAYLHSAGGVCLVVEDKLYFYYSGWSGESPNHGGHYYADGSTGVAFLRRDGFASMTAKPDETGSLTTRPVLFTGKHLFVNVDAPQGALRVEVLDGAGRTVPGFSVDECHPITADTTRTMVTWSSGVDLTALAGRPVRFRFHLSNGDLYAFWVSQDQSGASRGYVAAGGPGFTSDIDDVGSRVPPAHQP